MLLYWLYLESRSRTASYFYFLNPVTFPLINHQPIHPLLSWYRKYGWWIHNSLIPTLAVLPLWRESEVWSLRGLNFHSTPSYLLISFLCTYPFTYILSWLKSTNSSRALLGVDFVIALIELSFLLIYWISIISLHLYNWRSAIILIIKRFSLIVLSLTKHLYNEYELVQIIIGVYKNLNYLVIILIVVLIAIAILTPLTIP